MRIYKIRLKDTGYCFWAVYPSDMIPAPNEEIVLVDELHDFVSARRLAVELLTMVEMLEESESAIEDIDEPIHYPCEDWDDWYLEEE